MSSIRCAKSLAAHLGQRDRRAVVGDLRVPVVGVVALLIEPLDHQLMSASSRASTISSQICCWSSGSLDGSSVSTW